MQHENLKRSQSDESHAGIECYFAAGFAMIHGQRSTDAEPGDRLQALFEEFVSRGCERARHEQSDLQRDQKHAEDKTCGFEE